MRINRSQCVVIAITAAALAVLACSPEGSQEHRESARSDLTVRPQSEGARMQATGFGHASSLLPMWLFDDWAESMTPATVAGLVTGEGDVPLGEVWVGYMIIRWEETRFSVPRIEVQTGPDGRFATSAPEEVSVELVFDHDEYQSVMRLSQAPQNDMRIRMRRYHRLAGRVQWVSGAPVDGAEVNWSDTGGLEIVDQDAVTSADGRFEFARVPDSIELIVKGPDNGLTVERDLALVGDVTNLVVTLR
jgi:hypothetical protein